MAQCNVDGCDDAAVGSLIGLDGYQRAYRCRGCLLTDLHKVERGADA